MYKKIFFILSCILFLSSSWGADFFQCSPQEGCRIEIEYPDIGSSTLWTIRSFKGVAYLPVKEFLALKNEAIKTKRKFEIVMKTIVDVWIDDKKFALEVDIAVTGVKKDLPLCDFEFSKLKLEIVHLKSDTANRMAQLVKRFINRDLRNNRETYLVTMNDYVPSLLEQSKLCPAD
ncbi:hypothetical protein OAB57_02590 [Bacteriovoracaceae bacterium]|nr:hypothetical protein [Bacteriovoracaceae bacterium]